MAEFIHYKSEAMGRELEEMRRTNLFTEEEIRGLKIKREQFQHKLHSKDNYLKFIKYEIKLLQLCKKRRDKFKISAKKDDIEYNIIKRIKILQNEVITRYPDDITLKFNHINFCMQSNDTKATSIAITALTKSHPHDPKVWHVAADWQLESMKDIDGALNVLLKSLHYHKTNRDLLNKCFKLELIAAKHFKGNDKKKDDKLIVTKQEKQVAKAKVLFESAIKIIDDVDFYINLIEIAKKFDFTTSLQEAIVNYLRTNFDNIEITWYYLAQAELSVKVDPDVYSEDSITKLKICIENCIGKYKEGLKKLPTEKMWSYYLDGLMDLQCTEGTLVDFKTELLREAFEEGHKSKLMDEKYYLKWLSLMSGRDEALGILIKGLELLPKSLELWKAYLRYHILEDDAGSNKLQITYVFESAIKELNERAISLWIMYLQYHMFSLDNDTVDSIFKRAVEQPEEISETFKPQYIDWLVITFGRDKTREVYMQLATKKPYCKELHKKMALIESLKLSPDLEAWEKVHKLACEQFGHESTDVWIDYFTFDLKHNKGLNYTKIYNEAQKKLPESLKGILNIDLNAVRTCL